MSTPDPYTRAAHFFLLAEQVSRLSCLSQTVFWEMSVSPVRDLTACLPAMAAAVRKTDSRGTLWELAFHPLPGMLSPEAVPWHDHLVEAWKVHRASSDEKQRNLAWRALVRLDGCGMPDGMQRPSRLPEWLAEARRIGGARVGVGAGSELARTGEWRMEDLEALEPLANWRPAPGVVTNPETLREWVVFWLEIRQSNDPIRRGIAAMALLNLPEADLRAASLRPVSPEQLLRNLTTAIRAAAEWTDRSRDDNYLFLLDWQPVEKTAWPVAEGVEAVRAWLEGVSHNYWWCRLIAWRQLIHWNRTEILTAWGIDLLPHMVRAVQTEKDGDVLWELAQWMPNTGRSGTAWSGFAHSLFRQLERDWQRHRQSRDWLVRASGWLTGIRLHRAGLATETPESFREAYMSAVEKEMDESILLVLAQWSPGAGAPAVFHRKWQQGWQHRLVEGNEGIRRVAGYALLCRVLEKNDSEGLRRVALEAWRTGTKEGQTARQIPDAALSRLHEVRAHLVAGTRVDFEEEPAPPAQRQYPRLALPPGHIAEGEWRMDNGKLKMENDGAGLKPGSCPTPDAPSR